MYLVCRDRVRVWVGFGLEVWLGAGQIIEFVSVWDGLIIALTINNTML